MAEDMHSSEFYWDNIFIKVRRHYGRLSVAIYISSSNDVQVEDKLFCVPRCEFVKSSEVFADMFLLPSGPASAVEGRDREHPIVLEGYKKGEFACLLKVMYPTAESLISGTNLDLSLEKEEWVSVLKLSTIWNMKRIRTYAIHRLSTQVTFLPMEKILLARAHKVAAWLNEGVTSLVNDVPSPELEDIATLGWETAARILWIRDKSSLSRSTPNILRFRRDDIKCAQCSSPSSLINVNHNCYNCGQAVPADAELTFPGPGSTSGTTDRLVMFRTIQHGKCGTGSPFYSFGVSCSACSSYSGPTHNVRITLGKVAKDMIKEMFGEEIKDYEDMTVA
ncbi:unnamed protein product [Cyclocybe aegerita]|uniref:BTB domain-containing protein n=1 Tax=Cyclocybe aegerita TaxID=1973307 RepID=A0A8S0VRD8_CYCAE|nr:unnamed protein product [Cyclocybe aegerita]